MSPLIAAPVVLPWVYIGIPAAQVLLIGEQGCPFPELLTPAVPPEPVVAVPPDGPPYQ